MKAVINAGRRECRINGERDINSKEQKREMRREIWEETAAVALGEMEG